MKKAKTLEELQEQARYIEDDISSLQWKLDDLEGDLFNVQEQIEKMLKEDPQREAILIAEQNELDATKRQQEALRKRYGAERPSVSIADWWTQH